MTLFVVVVVVVGDELLDSPMLRSIDVMPVQTCIWYGSMIKWSGDVSMCHTGWIVQHTENYLFLKYFAPKSALFFKHLYYP